MKIRALLVASLLLPVAVATAAPLNEATITKVVNSVEVIPPDGQPQAATLGEIVRGRTGIRTGGASRAQLTFADQTLARLGANTLFSFERGTRALDLENGTILLQVPKDAGGATIRSAPVTAAITGTTVMMEYSPGNPGTVKLIVLEGTVRISLKGRLGESVLVKAGEMISVAADARSLPNPVGVDIKRVIRTSRLVQEGDLDSMGLIMETIEEQQQGLTDGSLVEGAPGPNLENPALTGASALATQNQRLNTVPPPTPPPPPPVMMTPPPTPPPTPPATPAPTPHIQPTPPPYTPPYTPPYNNGQGPYLGS
jgi:hypothetical protein